MSQKSVSAVPCSLLLLVVLGCAGARGSSEVEQSGPPPPVVMDTTVWTQFGGTSWYFNWTTLYKATGGYDYGVWIRLVFDEPETLSPSDPALLALGVRYYSVRMSDTLTEFRCADRARTGLTSTLRLSDSTILLNEEGSGTVNYGVPGTIGADIVDAVCARGRLMG